VTTIPATGNGTKPSDHYDTFLTVTGGSGNLSDDVAEVHLRIYNNAGDMFAQTWFRLDELMAALKKEGQYHALIATSRWDDES